nr:MAG TPA_asm: hypothetical protein [Caudoviricetes sp.]
MEQPCLDWHFKLTQRNFCTHQPTQDILMCLLMN